MRPIKFRGKTFDGKLVSGDLLHWNGKILVDGYSVKPESVAQLLGYDADGNEIYEGEKVFGIGGMMIDHTFTARVANVAMSTNGMLWGFLPEDVRKADSTRVE